jgi:anti-sigma regulatory factor (Ser/Thr protein kinase)
VLDLELPAAHSAGRMARHLVRQFGKANAVAGKELDILVLVADELLTNAVDHGGGGSAFEESDVEGGARMTLRLSVTAAEWELRVSDQGGGDPAEVEAYLRSAEEPELDDERGRGFFMMAQVVDRLDVRRSDDGRGILLIASRRWRRR